MADYMDDQERKSVLLEGMYKGVSGKIEDVKKTVCMELQYSSAQTASSYDSISSALKEGIESVFSELRFLAQQNSAIYDLSQTNREATREEIVRTVNGEIALRIDALSKALGAKLDGAVADLTARYDEKLAQILKKLDEPVQLPDRPAEAAPAAEIDYDELAARISERLATPKGEEAAEPAEEPLTEEEASAASVDETIDYDVLAEKISTILPEIDYDTIAERVVAAIPQQDDNALVDRFVAAVPQTDENAIAERVAEAIVPVDYDLIAERVVQSLASNAEPAAESGNEEQAEQTERLASAVSEKIDYEKLAQRVVELLKADESDIARIVSVATEPIREESVPAEESERDIASDELAAAATVTASASVAGSAVPVAVPVPVALLAEEETAAPEMFTRYKRSFTAKIMQSEEEIKGYYGDLKNAFMSYSKVRSQVNWSNDRFAYGGDTVAKIGMSGKTLCLYVALDPEEFPKTVYHQRYEGDKKMYEKTPMMVKIKSAVACRRAVKLVELLMERNGAVKTETDPVDYVKEFPYKTDDELLAQGLIKTALVEKTDLNF